MYKKIRYLGSTCHIYEFNQVTHDVKLEYGKVGILEPLSKMALGGTCTVPASIGNIADAQTSLNKYYGANLVVDGKWGPASQAAWDKAHGTETVYGPPAEAKINCGFFAFNASSENYGIWSNGWTTVTYNDGGDQLLHFHDPETMDIKTFNTITKANTLVLGASYTLMENGTISIRNTAPFPHWTQRNPRTMFAQLPNRNMLFIVVDGRRWNEKGMTAKEQAQLCMFLKVRCAVNFDGGGSSEMIVGAQIMNRPSDGGERRIGTCLATYLKIP